MKKISTLVATALIFSSTNFAYAYNYPEYIIFESTNHCSGCDLSNATITPNHSRAKLTNANLSGLYTLHGTAANLSQADLSNTNMVGANLYSANFTEANLAGAKLESAHVENANFYGATGLDLTHAYACGATLPNGDKMPAC
jgi:uncharacterized protein YjbI with pentapeptide repeats